MKKLMVAAGLAVALLSGCAVYPYNVGYSQSYGYRSYPAYSSYTVVAPMPVRPFGWGHGGGHHWHH